MYRHIPGESTETSPRSLQGFHFPACSGAAATAATASPVEQLWLLISHNFVAPLPLLPQPRCTSPLSPAGEGEASPRDSPIPAGDFPDPSGRVTRSAGQPRTAAPVSLPPAAPAGILLSACSSLLFREFLPSLSGAEGGIKGIKDQTCDSVSTGMLKEGGEGEMAGGHHRTPGGDQPLEADSGVNPEPQEDARGGGGCAARAPHSCSTVPERSIRSGGTTAGAAHFPQPFPARVSPLLGVTSVECHV